MAATTHTLTKQLKRISIVSSTQTSSSSSQQPKANRKAASRKQADEVTSETPRKVSATKLLCVKSTSTLPVVLTITQAKAGDGQVELLRIDGYEAADAVKARIFDAIDSRCSTLADSLHAVNSRTCLLALDRLSDANPQGFSEVLAGIQELEGANETGVQINRGRSTVTCRSFVQRHAAMLILYGVVHGNLV